MPRWNKNYFSFSFGDHPLITKSPYGLDLKIRNIPEPVSQPVDMHIHSADIGLGIISPQLVHDLLTGKGMVREGQQLVQQLKFLLRKDLGIIVNCDGQIDIDMIQGEDKRKTVLRIDLDNADVIAPMDSERMAGYRHLQTKKFYSLQPDAKTYGVVIRSEGKEEKLVLEFEPNEKMMDLILNKYPKKAEK